MPTSGSVPLSNPAKVVAKESKKSILTNRNVNPTYRIDDNKIYYTDISESKKDKMNLSIFEIDNEQVFVSYVNDLEINREGD